jgi:HPr kinase/phosphorylase
MAGSQTPIAIPILVHGTAVVFGDKGLLIIGPSGSGKSSLALRLITMGARLVADDQVLVLPTSDGPLAQAPDRLAGLIEARHLGILRLPHIQTARLTLIVDLSEVEADRLPQRHVRELAGFLLPLVKASQIDHMAPALFCYLMGERQD